MHLLSHVPMLRNSANQQRTDSRELDLQNQTLLYLPWKVRFPTLLQHSETHNYKQHTRSPRARGWQDFLKQDPTLSPLRCLLESSRPTELELSVKQSKITPLYT